MYFMYFRIQILLLSFISFSACVTFLWLLCWDFNLSVCFVVAFLSDYLKEKTQWPISLYRFGYLC